MNRFLTYENRDGVVTLTMNRPEQRNALSETSQMLEFVEICHEMEHDNAVRAVILTGAGSAFSAGGNIKHMRDKRSEEHTSELQSLMRISYAAFCLKKKIQTQTKIKNTR